MAQLGLHGLIGAALGRAAAPAAGRGLEARRALCWGLALGSLLPDTDFFLMLPAYLAWGDRAVVLHRTWSHSLLVALVAALLVLAFARRRRGALGLALGVGLGMLLHDVTDLLVWFSPVGLLWPLSLGGGPAGALGAWRLLGAGRLDLWAWAHVPRLVSSLLGALDYLALACYFMYLTHLARRAGLDQGFLPRLRGWTWAAWGLFGLYLALAVVLGRRGGLFDLAHYAVLILVFLPVALWVTVRMRATLEALAAPSEAA